jgi:hypothetical protein
MPSQEDSKRMMDGLPNGLLIRSPLRGTMAGRREADSSATLRNDKSKNKGSRGRNGRHMFRGRAAWQVLRCAQDDNLRKTKDCKGRTRLSPPFAVCCAFYWLRCCLFSREAPFDCAQRRLRYSAAISSCSPSMRMSSSSRSSASMADATSCWTWAAASSSSGESWTLR